MINCQTLELKIYVRREGCVALPADFGGGEVRLPAAQGAGRAQAALPVPPVPVQRQMKPRNMFHSEKSWVSAGMGKSTRDKARKGK